MTKHITEFEIIETLRIQSKNAQPSEQFKEELKSSLTNHLQRKEVKLHTMNKSHIYAGISAFALILVVFTTVYILNANNSAPDNGQDLANGNTQLSSANNQNSSSLDTQLAGQQGTDSANQLGENPQQTLNNLDEAKSKVSYKLKVPSVKVGNESLTKVSMGINYETKLIDEFNSIYLTYSDNAKVLYKLYQAKQSIDFPSYGEKVKINGSDGVYIPRGASAGENAESLGNASKSSIQWQVGNMFYEITEFGQLSKEQLIKLAQSVKE